MTYVTQYSKASNTNPLYDAKVCLNDRCNILQNQYKFENMDPKNQIFPFPSTSDNKVFMVPNRVAQDEQALKEYVISKAKSQTCFDIDPCDVYTSKYCCPPKGTLSSEQTKTVSSEDTKNTETPNAPTGVSNGALALFFVVVGVLVLIMLCIFFIMLVRK